MHAARSIGQPFSKRSFVSSARSHIAAAVDTTAHAQHNTHNAFTHGEGRIEPSKAKTVAIKDNIVTRSTPTTAASHILSDYTSPFEATVVTRLRSNGFIIADKSNLDEFGMGSHTQTSALGSVTSCYTRSGVALSPGGSSGGSAVAVATGACWAALGTDTGGSVRLPAAYMGVVGFKPSYGRVSRWGVIQYANSLDTVGVLARNVQDVRELWGCLDAFDELDPTSLSVWTRRRCNQEWEKRRDGANGRLEKKLRIGIPLDYNIVELSPAVREAYIHLLDRLQADGHTLHAVSLPSTRQALSAYYTLAPAEASSNLSKYDGVRYGRRTTGGPDVSAKNGLPLYAQTRSEGFGDEVQRRILLGAYSLSSGAMDNYFIQAQKVRRLVQGDFDGVFDRTNPLLDTESHTTNTTNPTSKIDILLTPTAPTLPPTIDQVARQTPEENYMNDVFTVPASLAGLPAISVPVALDAQTLEGMDGGDVRSVGMQVVGQFGDDEGVLEAAEMVERFGGLLV